jgi:hypothetical protein
VVCNFHVTKSKRTEAYTEQAVPEETITWITIDLNEYQVVKRLIRPKIPHFDSSFPRGKEKRHIPKKKEEEKAKGAGI